MTAFSCKQNLKSTVHTGLLKARKKKKKEEEVTACFVLQVCSSKNWITQCRAAKGKQNGFVILFIYLFITVVCNKTAFSSCQNFGNFFFLK